MTITIKDVARLAGVSISTVSRVINESKPVSGEIKAKVLKVIEETNYVPNPVARSLVLQKSNFIGVIAPDISDCRIGDILNGIEEVGKIYGYDILLCNSYGKLQEEINYVEFLLNKQVAGMIILSPKLTQELVELVSGRDIPTVYVSQNATELGVISVGIDYEEAGRDAARWILSRGYDSICALDIRYKGESRYGSILDGFLSTIESRRGKCTVQTFDYTKNGFEEIYRSMGEYIDSTTELPRILFVPDDEAAIGVINALLDKGIKVPEDVSVLGFGNSKVAGIVRPGLTTVSEPLYDIGAVAIRILIKQIEDPDEKLESMVLPHSIEKRQSVK